MTTHLCNLAVAASYWLEQPENFEENDEGVAEMEAALEWARAPRCVRDLELVKDLERIARAPSQHPAWSIRAVMARAATALSEKAAT